MEGNSPEIQAEEPTARTKPARFLGSSCGSTRQEAAAAVKGLKNQQNLTFNAKI